MESANIIICCDQVWLSSKKGRKENVWCEAKVFCQTCCLLGGLWAVIRDSLVLLWTEISKDLGQRSSGAIGCTCDVAISQLGVCVRGVVVPHCSQHDQLAFCVSCLSENLHWVCLRYFGQFPHILSPPPPFHPVTSHFTFEFLAPILFSIYHFDSISGWPCVLFPSATF